MADEDTTIGGGRSGGRERRGPRPRRRRGLYAAAWATVGALVLAGAGLGLVYSRIDGNIAGIDIDSVLGPDRPADVPDGTLDILLLGSDTRAGDNSRYGRDDGTARSDTAMIVHINKEHDRASIVSIPRDTLVERPECEKTGGGTAPAARRAMFNQAYEIGGPACTVKTVESMTGIRMDHYVELDFDGFEKVVDELGGVEVTVTEPIEDEDSRLELEPGRHTLDGERALALVRTRKGVGNGSDLGRIKLQHTFVEALADRVGEVRVFSDPKKTYDLLDTVTSHLTTDAALASVPDLAGLAGAVKGIDSQDIETVTLPVRYSSADPNRVVPIGVQTERIWDALKADRPIPDSATKGSAAREATEAEDAVEAEGAGGGGQAG
ncbi:LCP family protein [Streptomyces sp. S1A]|uniref:LCP family protein n=1 Tax=Streptomyces sp. ICN903 TaxID=2964654 RepID=UPI001EDB59DB|nr:LCP family protein [Streptomyces sp. ICN903]MCG3042762.1 LCP family protein [Streptomyces sp. ICN903]